MNEQPLLIELLRTPSRSATLSLSEWDLLVRQARRANLLARLAGLLEGQTVPDQVRPHLDSALLLALRQGDSVRRELVHIRTALSECGSPVVLLKGAAYLMAGLQVSQGRLFSDIDILVRPASMPVVETALMVNGWDYDELDAYDQQYYRRWMHELPPLQHKRRGTAIDVHHTILPPTSRTRIAGEALFEQLIELPGMPGVFMLPPTDMLLHSAAHLFHEGEFDNGLRDLFDLDALLREFGADPAFWPQLLARAHRIGLQRPLHHALRYARLLLDTPMPPGLLDQLAALPGGQPGRLVQAALDHSYRRALRPQHASCALPGSELALTALYVRSHWLRMPLHLLTYHLGRKLLKRMSDSQEPEPA